MGEKKQNSFNFSLKSHIKFIWNKKNEFPLSAFHFNQSLNQTQDSPGNVKKRTISRRLCFQWISVHDNRKKCHSSARTTVSRLREIRNRISLEINQPLSLPSSRWIILNRIWKHGWSMNLLPCYFSTFFWTDRGPGCQGQLIWHFSTILQFTYLS